MNVRVNNVKIPIGPKTTYRFNASLMKLSIKFKHKYKHYF